jgi:6-phosphogluconolactonase (cycloisomerase 2 family)
VNRPPSVKTPRGNGRRAQMKIFQNVWFRACEVLVPLAILTSGCEDYWFGEGMGVETEASAPEGVQSGLVPIDFVLSGEIDKTDVTVSFSTDGVTFFPATRATGGEGTRNLRVGPSGTLHTFVWDSARDLGGDRHPSVNVRITPEDGPGARTEYFAVHNSFFLAALENQGSTIRLYRLDVSEQELALTARIETGGTAPSDVLFHDGLFIVSHERSNDLAVFILDEETENLVPVTPSSAEPAAEQSLRERVSGRSGSVPSRLFRTGGRGARHLAAFEGFVFVSNAQSQTVSVLDIDPETSALTLNSHSGVSVPRCGDLAVSRSTLYVASGAGPRIVAFDIASDGALLFRSETVVTGLSGLGPILATDGQVYAASADSAGLSAFAILDDGSLEVLSSSTLPSADSGVSGLAHSSGLLFAATGPQATVVAVTLDEAGAPLLSGSSALPLTGSSYALASTSDIVVFATSDSEQLEVLWLDSMDSRGRVASRLYPTDAAIVKLAISD